MLKRAPALSTVLPLALAVAGGVACSGNIAGSGEGTARVRGPHHAPDLCVGVLEREVPVALPVLLEPDDFASDPEWCN